MTEVWRIGPPCLVDNYRQPHLPGEVRWRAGALDAGQRWPLFHPSEADPDGGYRLHPYILEFELVGDPAPAYVLRIDYLVIAPRIGRLEVSVNGTRGTYYLRPKPSASGELRLHAALHTPLYGEGEIAATLPGELFRPGLNEITLTCWDGAAVTPIANLEKIKRLDRMATGAGFIYQSLEMWALVEAPRAVGAVSAEPTVLYRLSEDGMLVERCELYASFNRRSPQACWQVRVESTGQVNSGATVSLDLPTVNFGEVRQSFEVADGEGPVRCYVSGETLDGPLALERTFERRRKWTVYVAPHLHTDIGYTHRQWEVAERLSHNLDAALDAGTHYHVDSAWVLDNYLATRSAARIEQLMAAVRERRMGIAGNDVILLSQFAALEDLIRNTNVAGDYLRPHGLRSRFSAVVDVPSLSRSLPDVLAGAGVRYLVHASNQDRGPFRVNGGLHRQSPYYWQGAAGGRVLVWLSKMYCELRKVCGSPPDVSAGERGLELWLQEFERADYAPDAVLLYGQEADNTDLDPQPAEFVRAWNEVYAYPRLVPCAVDNFFEDVEARFGAALPTIAGDGGAYWEDGAGSTLAETMLARQAQAELPAAERLAALAVLHQPSLAYPQAHFDQAWRSLLLFDEHTWGAFLSWTDPEAKLQRDQWAVKAHFAHAAAQGARRLLHSAITRHSLQWNAEGREVAVYNPHSWAASSAVTVEHGRDEVIVDTATGEPVPQRRVSASATQTVTEFWVEPLRGLSYRRYGLRPPVRQPEPAFVVGSPSSTLENHCYRLTLDPARGCVTSWFDKTLDRELVDGGDAWDFGQLLFATGGAGTRLVSNQADLPEGDPQVSGDFSLTESRFEADDLGQRMWLHGATAAGEVEIEWALPTQARQANLTITLRKPERREHEAVYVAFPLALPGARVQSDSQLGWVDWNADRLPGACQEWLPLQTAFLVSTPEVAVCVASPDVPLFCVGDVVRGRWPVEGDLSGGRLFSYVLNNYWRTNYKASQGGELVFRYQLTSAAAIAPAAAYRFGWLTRQPLYAQRLSLQEFRSPAPPYIDPTGGTLAAVSPDAVELTTLHPARWAQGWVARFQELGGHARTATLRLPGRCITRAWLTDLMEYDQVEIPVAANGTLAVEMPAWGLQTVRFEVDP